MKKTVLFILGGLAAAVALQLPSTSMAEVGGWVMNPPSGGYPSLEEDVVDNPPGWAYLRFDAAVHTTGAYLDVQSAITSYTTQLHLYCTTGWAGIVTKEDASGTIEGDIIMNCNVGNGGTGTAAFYYGDT